MRLIVFVYFSFLTLFEPALCLEPFSSVGVLVASGLGYKYYDKIKLNTYCRYAECCNNDVIPHDILSLKDNLESKLFGQHIVQEKIFRAVASHYENIDSSKKPLVLTFHGTQGTGKNYVANIIAEAVFKKGAESKFFHLFHGSQYSDASNALEHRNEIKKEITESIESCPYSIFVFDEVDKMPAGIFDGITSLLDHHRLIKGVNFRKAVFIFLTNYGGEEIAKILHRLVSKEGLYRHEAKLHHFEEIIKLGVYNQEGGLKETDMIKAAVIDFYIPFLPLEEKHVVECIKEEFRNCLDKKSQTNNDAYEFLDEKINEVLKYIGFHKVTNYAHTGCKTVYAKVQAECF